MHHIPQVPREDDNDVPQGITLAEHVAYIRKKLHAIAEHTERIDHLGFSVQEAPVELSFYTNPIHRDIADTLKSIDLLAQLYAK